LTETDQGKLLEKPIKPQTQTAISKKGGGRLTKNETRTQVACKQVP